MIGYIEDLYKALEEIEIPETDDPVEARFQILDAEHCILRFFYGLTDEDMKNCLPLAVLNELWGWYCGGTEDGVYQYFEHVNKELTDDTADVLRKYGCDEFAKQYINAGKELIPLLEGQPPYSEPDLINETSERYERYIEVHANEICITIIRFLLDRKEEICTALYGRVFRTGHDDPRVIHGVLDPEAFFADFINNPLLDDEQRADAAAALERAKKMMNGNI